MNPAGGWVRGDFPSDRIWPFLSFNEHPPPPSQDNYSSFCNLDSKGMCYRFEVSLSGPAIELHNCMAKLLAHPLQRPFQSHASYSLLEGDDPEDAVAMV